MPTPLHHPIRWDLIAEATAFYTGCGYRHVEVPWVVPPAIARATAPPWVTPHATSEGVLIGSGEQGLLYLALQGLLPPGRYQTTTPCFRDDIPDDLHGRHFVKVEIMHLTSTHDEGRILDTDRDRLLNDAEMFLIRYLPVQRTPINTEPGQIDLVCATTGIELGSYGLRQFKNVAWAYGTGVAEPRLSTVMAMSLS